MSFQIHWHEGLFLQPHHLQRFQKSMFDAVTEARSLTFPYPYGVVEMSLNYDELENKRLHFRKLRVVTRGGLEVDVPRNADLPIIDIKKAFDEHPGGFAVALAVPLWVDDRANTIEPGARTDPRAKLIYRAVEKEFLDENTGENAKPLMVRRINARLIMEDEDPSDMEVLPLLRIMRSTNEESSVPRQDPEFTPACLTVNASPSLRDIVRDLSAQIEASRKELVVQMTRGGTFDLANLRGLQFEQVWRLRSINRYAAKCLGMAAAPSITPFVWYTELRELLSEILALYPASTDYDVIPYDHDNPAVCFRDLSDKIRKYLRGTVAPSYWKVEFKQDGPWLGATFEDKHFTVPSDYLLGVRSKQDARGLAALVENRDEFKLMPKSMIERAYFGLPMKEERHPPLELPAAADLHYFRLNRTEGARHWDLMQREKAACIRWPESETVDYQISLYMVVPPSASAK